LKKILIFAIFVLIINSAICWGVTYYDDPISIGIGARPISMGKAFVAVADDPNAMFLNPAGLGTLKAWELSTMSLNLLDEYQYTMFCGVNPTPSGVFGIGYVSSRVGGIIVSPGITTDFYNQATVLSYGRDTEEYFPDTYAGASVKYYQKGFTGGDSASLAGYNIDLGLLYVPQKWMSYGLNFQNVVPGSQLQGDIESEEMSFITKIGASFYWMEYDVRFALDKDMYLGRENFPWPMHFGGEWKASQNLYLRAGYDQVASSADVGDVINNPSFGLGLEYSGIKIDLAYMQNFAQTNITSNVVSLSFYSEPVYFQETQPKKEEPPKKEVVQPADEKASAPPAVVSVETVAVTFKTVDKKISVTPSGNLYTLDPAQTFSGKIDFDVTDVWVDGKKLQIRSDRIFATTVPLNIGKNEKMIRVIDTGGAQADIMTKIVRFYLPTDLSYDEVNSKYFEYKVIYTELYRYLGKDYNTNKNLTREILALIITKAKKLNISPSQNKVSKDIDAMYWAAKYIRAVKYAGIMSDYSDGTFKADKIVTRSELARIMGKATGMGEATTLAYLTGKLPEEAATLDDMVEIIYRSGLLGEDVDDYKAFIGYEGSIM
jgi:hypothetical protein